MDAEQEERERSAVTEVAGRLAKKFPDAPAGHVSAVVEEKYAELLHAKLRDYLPVLVEHDARKVLNTEKQKKKKKG